MSLSEKLKMLRDGRNWSQQYLADRMNVDRSTISRYETGRSIPTYQTVIRFAEVFQVDKELLVNELDLMLPQTEKSGYVLKEKLNDKDLELAIELLLQEPELKAVLLEIDIMEPVRRSYFIEKMKAEIKVLKRYKRV